MSQNDAASYENLHVEKKFKDMVLQWYEHLSTPEMQRCSNPEKLVDCKAYHDIVRLGQPALPLMIDGMREGQFLFWYAVREITEVNLVPEGKYLNGKFLSEQDIAKLYVDWWVGEGKKQFNMQN